MNVLLICQSAPLGVKVLYCLRNAGAKVHVLSNRPNALRLSRFVKRYVTHGFPNKEESRGPFIDWINQYISSNDIGAVVAADIGAEGLLFDIKNDIRQAVCFPVSSRELLGEMHDKWRFTQLLQESGIATPATRFLEHTADIDSDAFANLEFPLVVKPLECESSHGIYRFEDMQALRTYIHGNHPYNTPPLILQEFIPGQDVGLSVLAQAGEIVVWTNDFYLTDSVREFARDEQVLELGRQIIKLTNYSGPAYFDMRVDSRTGKLVVFECNPRFWFTIPASMWHGVNFVEAGLALAKGEDVSGIMSSYRLGKFYLNGELAKSALWSFRTLREVSWRNFRGLLQVLSDPLPHAYDLFLKLQPTSGR